MINVILFALGMGTGLAVVGWPLMQVYFALAVGFPIARRFERAGNVIPQAKPSRRYVIGGLVNLALLVPTLWAVFTFGTRPFLYGTGLGVAYIAMKMLRGTKAAGIEAYQMIGPELNEIGKLLAEDDLARHGIVEKQSTTPVIHDPDGGSTL